MVSAAMSPTAITSPTTPSSRPTSSAVSPTAIVSPIAPSSSTPSSTSTASLKSLGSLFFSTDFDLESVKPPIKLRIVNLSFADTLFIYNFVCFPHSTS
ncbi:hypothetical protein MRB53_002109 [Persea americana]|uniref:Uncharacterized protein n=1 Tax=Persea americana TaxID=3435 RepID=A0ACC2MUH2_PERAE|nr:hypothetical protein MRB53_002109 [Persea americana]